MVIAVDRTVNSDGNPLIHVPLHSRVTLYQALQQLTDGSCFHLKGLDPTRRIAQRT
jgi:hypothetical protein